MKTIIGSDKTKTKQVSYLDPATGEQVTKTVVIPPSAKVKTLSCGATVEEIPNMEALTTLWTKGIISDLTTPLTNHSRQVLAAELKKSLSSREEHQAIDALAATWQVPDDVALKVLGRLAKAVERQKKKRKEEGDVTSMATREMKVQLSHQNRLLEEKVQHLQQENKTLHGDISKIVNERDALNRHKNATSISSSAVSRANQEAREARVARKQSQDDHRCTQVRLAQTEQALTEAVNGSAAVAAERDALQRDAQRNLEAALGEYENEIVGKLTSVASDHNKKAEEVAELRKDVVVLTHQRNILRIQVDNQCNQIQQMSIAKVQKESAMENENENVVETFKDLKAGDEVYCKVSGEGPFTLVTQVDEAVVEYANPISGRKNAFNIGKLPITNAWLMRCKDGSMRTFPAPILTTARPKRTMSFGGIRNLITSPVTSKAFQAVVWITMLALLYMKQAG